MSASTSCAYCSSLLAGRQNVRRCQHDGCDACLCCANCQREHHDSHLPEELGIEEKCDRPRCNIPSWPCTPSRRRDCAIGRGFANAIDAYVKNGGEDPTLGLRT